MRDRDIILLAVLTLGLAGIGVALYLIGLFTSSQMTYNRMVEMMRHMMGYEAVEESSLLYLWILLSFFVVMVLVSAAYMIIGARTRGEIIKEEVNRESGEKGVETLLRVLRPDEREVVRILLEREGKALQRDIRRETGFSRLRIHRIVNRLVERNIVQKRRVGSTNEVMLADWVQKMREFRGELSGNCGA